MTAALAIQPIVMRGINAIFAERAVDVGETNNETIANASIQGMFVPKSVYWPTLEDRDKEEGASCDNGGEHSGVEDPGVYALDTNSEKEETDRELCEDHGPAVEDVAEPPTVPGLFDLFRR
jgi:hypothetical protein